jgi:hypothetical protein
MCAVQMRSIFYYCNSINRDEDVCCEETWKKWNLEHYRPN